MSDRIMVTGSRTWSNAALVREVLVDIEVIYGSPLTLVSGGCPKGADRIAEHMAARLGWTVEQHLALWNTHGKAAGFIRNEQMVASMPRLCVAFWDGSSRGTKHSIDLCQRYGVGLFVYRKEGPWLMPSGTSRTGLVGS